MSYSNGIYLNSKIFLFIYLFKSFYILYVNNEQWFVTAFIMLVNASLSIKYQQLLLYINY